MDQVVTTKKVKRRWPTVLIVGIVLLVAAVVAMPSVLAPFVRRKLEAAISNHLHARMEIGSLSYSFPYGVVVRDAKFITDGDSDDSVQLLTLKTLDLSLAELPLGNGPIVVKSFRITEPVLHIVRREDGTVVGSHLAKAPDKSPNPRDRMKLSDLFELRHFTLTNATIVLDDRTNRDARPMEWRNINATLELNPQSGSRYSIHFAADSKPVAHIDFTGTADIDSRIIDVEKFAITAAAQRGSKTSPLPAQFQTILDELGIEGAVQVDLSGQVPLMQPKESHVVVNVALDRVRVQPQDGRWAMEELSAKLRAERGTGEAARRVDVKLSKLNARGIGATLQVESALGVIDLIERTWRVEGLSGLVHGGDPLQVDPSRRSVMRYVQSGRIDFEGTASGAYGAGTTRPVRRANLIARLDRVSIFPPNFPEPIDAISGQITVNSDRAMAQNFTALYGNDRLVLNQMVISLTDPFTRIDMLNILGSAEFAAPAARYPAPLGAVVNQLKPAGKIDIQGCAALYRRGNRLEPDYALQIIPQGTSITLLDNRLSVTDLHGEINIAPRLIELKYVEGASFAGRVAARGSAVPRMPVKYDGEIRAQDIDVGLVAQAFGFLKEDNTPKATGRAVAKLKFNGEWPEKGKGDPTRSLVGHGRVYVKDGNFWSVPVLDGMVKEIKFAHNALSAGQAAGAFDIKDGKVVVSRAAVNSSALGVQGSGTVELRRDGKAGEMDLHLVAAPLGDWRRKMRSTGIPLISDVAGDIAGALQKLVNTATSQLLYEFRVTGRIGQPKIWTVPAPLLTDSVASLFGVMMRDTPSDRLIEEIDGRDPDEPKPTSTSNGN